MEDFKVWFKVSDKDYMQTERLFNSSGDYITQYTANARSYLTKNIIVDKEDTAIKALVPEIEINSAILENIGEDKLQIYDLSGATIFLCNSKSIKRIDAGELEKYVYGRNDSARVLLYSEYTELHSAYVYAD